MRIQTLCLSGLIWSVLATAVGAVDGRSMDQISQEEVRRCQGDVEKQMQENGGVFVFRDNRAGENLRRVRDIRLVRSIHGYGFSQRAPPGHARSNTPSTSG
jgi:hypothetical protein